MPLLNRKQLNRGAWDQANKAPELLLKILSYIKEFKGDEKRLTPWLQSCTRQITHNLKQIRDVSVINPGGEVVQQIQAIYPLVSASLAKYLRARKSSAVKMDEQDWLALKFLINGYDDSQSTTEQEQYALKESIEVLINDSDSYVVQHAAILRYLALNTLEPQSHGVLKEKYQEGHQQLLECCFKIMALAASTHEIEQFDQADYKATFRAWKQRLTETLEQIYDSHAQELIQNTSELSKEEFISRTLAQLTLDNGQGYANLKSINRRPSYMSDDDSPLPAIDAGLLMEKLAEFIAANPKVWIETKKPAEIWVDLDKLKAMMARCMDELNSTRSKHSDSTKLVTLKSEIIELISSLQHSEIATQKAALEKQYNEAKQAVEQGKSKLLLFSLSLTGNVEEVISQLDVIKGELQEAYSLLITIEKDTDKKESLQQECDLLIQKIESDKAQYTAQYQSMNDAQNYAFECQRIRELINKISQEPIERLEDMALGELLETYSELTANIIDSLLEQLRALEEIGLTLSDNEEKIAEHQRTISRLEHSLAIFKKEKSDIRAKLIPQIKDWICLNGGNYPPRDNLEHLQTVELLDLYQQMWSADYEVIASAGEITKPEAISAPQETATPITTNFDLEDFVSRFIKTFKHSNSKGINRIIGKMNLLIDASNQTSAPEKLKDLRDYIAETGRHLEHRAMSRFSFWFMKGRTDGVQKLYSEAARVEFKQQEPIDALKSLNKLIEENTEHYTFVHQAAIK